MMAMLCVASMPTLRAVDPAPASTTNLAALWSASVTAETGQNYDEAIAQLTAYQQKGGDKFMASLRAGWLYYLKADYVKATDFYTAANRISPRALNPLFGLLYVAQAQVDSKTISRVAELILKEEPTNYRALTTLGDLYYKAGDYQKSRSYYRRVLVTYPDDLYATSGAAWTALKVTERAEAKELFRKILGMSPDYTYAQQGYDLASGQAQPAAPAPGNGPPPRQKP